MTKEGLKDKLELHKKWLADEEGGQRLVARGAGLRGADLRYVNFRVADLRGANLRNADFRGADMRYADLRDTDLQGANLKDANLVGAVLGRGESVNVEPIARWDRRFLALAKHISLWSKDPSTKVGCVVVGPDREIRSTGYNGFARGVADTAERYEDREQKYPLICHAEENAIMHAARIGVSLKGCTAFVTWPPCARCARSFIQAGIMRVVFPSVEVPDRWLGDFVHSQHMMIEAGVEVSIFPDEQGARTTSRIMGFGVQE